MNDAHVEMFNEPLANRGNVPTYEEMYPEPPVIIIDDEEIPDDKVVESLFNWQGWWNNRIAWLKRNWGWIALVVLIFIWKGC